jgi:hypothetical protein
VQADGTAYLFSNRKGTGSVGLTSVNPTAFLFLRLALLVAGYPVPVPRARARDDGRGAWIAFLAPFLAILLLLPAGRVDRGADRDAARRGPLGCGLYLRAVRDARERRRPRARPPPWRSARRRLPATPPATPPTTGGVSREPVWPCRPAHRRRSRSWRA